MTCEEARLALLEAEPADMRARGDGALAIHLRGCDACAARAAVILAGTGTLRTVLATAVDAAVAAHAAQADAVRAEHASHEETAAMHASVAGDGVARHVRVRASRSRRIGGRVLAPVALAAMLAGVLLIGDRLRVPFGAGSLTTPFSSPLVRLYVPAPRVPDAPVVNAAPGSDVAVMRTTNPDITVVWTF